MNDVSSRAQRLGAVVKAYDVRGLVPMQLDADVAAALGWAFAAVAGERRDTPPREVVIGHDMRASSPGLASAFADGLASRGVSVTLLGLASTDLLYFASGTLGLPGVMITASHNPAGYNGFKLCRAGASPVGLDTGLAEMASLAASAPDHLPGTADVRRVDLLPDYVAKLHQLVPLEGLRRLRVVVDAGNGMAGLTVPASLADSPIAVVPMYFELDGSFPNHPADPLDPANLVDLQRAVISNDADLGLAFDGDADRCFVVDERGSLVDGSTVTALIAERALAVEPGATVIHNCITSRAVPELVRRLGGHPVRTRVGHSFIKAAMAQTGAVVGGEHSGHYYFRDFWRADSGMLAALHVLAALGERPEGTRLSAMLATYARYRSSGERNSTVPDVASATVQVRAAFAEREGVSIDLLDGLTVEHADWWFNLRPSNTEPLLRLNVEAADDATVARIVDEVLSLVRSEGEAP